LLGQINITLSRHTQHHETMSPATSRASTVTDQEFADTYSIARTKLDVI
jgi:hypothetical protein